MRRRALISLVMVLVVPSAAQAQGTLEFTDWTSSNGTVAIGTLRGHTITLSGPIVDPPPQSRVDGTSNVFDMPEFTPRIPLGDSIQIRGGFSAYSYTLDFGGALKDPVVQVGSTASRLDFPAGTQIERVSGGSNFTVQGSSVIGALTDPFDQNGTVRFVGTYTTLPFTATAQYVGCCEDGLELQIGALEQPLVTPHPPPPQPTPVGSPNQPLPPTAEPLKTVLAAPTSGQVRVKVPGKGFVALDQLAEVPVGATIDATKGSIAFTSATDTAGGIATARIAAGIFRVQQLRAKETDLVLVTPPGQARACASSQTRPAKGVVRRLRVTATKGVFRTVGKRSVSKGSKATWVTEDRCDGTLTKVRRGRVKVRASRKTHTLGPGDTFLAHARLFAAKRPR